MKKINSSSNHVTRGYLKKEFSIFEARFDLKLDNFKIEIDEIFQKYRDQILRGIDKVYGELQSMREENTAGTFQTSELEDRLDNHEKRLTKLEQTHHAA